MREHAALLHLIGTSTTRIHVTYLQSDEEEKVVAAAERKQQAIEDAIAAGSAVQCCICFTDDIPVGTFSCLESC